MSVRYVVARLITTAFLALAATLVVFAVAHVVPTDPIIAQLGDRAANDPEIVAAYRARWGLDRSLPEQYVTYIWNLVHGDAGVSIKTHRPVTDDIGRYAPATFELATMAALIAVSAGIPLGITAAVRRDSWIDHVARFLSLFGAAVPTFWLAFIALALFYGGLGIAPGPGRLDATISAPPTVTGLMLVDSLIAGSPIVFGNALSHMVLPACVLAATSLGLITRTMRASMLETLGEDYVRTARAKGVPERRVITRHAARNALIPVVTLAGLMYAQLLSGAVMTETIFSWPGLGRYSFQSAVSADFPSLMGVTLFVAIAYLLINLVVDLSLAVIDPRIANR